MPTTKKTGGRKKARSAKQKAATKKLVAMNRARAKAPAGGNRKARRASASKSKSHARKPAARRKATRKGKSRSMRGVDGVGLGDVGDVLEDGGEGLQAVGVGRARRRAKRKAPRKAARRKTTRKTTRRRSHSLRGVEGVEAGLGKMTPLTRAIRATGHTQRGVIEALLRGGSLKTEHKKPSKKGRKKSISRIVQIARMNETTVADVEAKIAACGLKINPRKARSSKSETPLAAYGTSDKPFTGVYGISDRVENPVPSAMGIKEVVIAAVTGGLFFTLVDLGDRYLATMKPKGQTSPVVGQQALSAIESPPGALRLGVQGGVALLGGMGAYAVRNRSPKAAAALVGIAAAAGTHAVWQLLSSRAMPALLKAQSPNDVTTGNRLYPDYQAYMVAANKLAALAPASAQPSGGANNPLPMSAFGVGNPGRQLGPVTAGYPASYRQPGLGQVGVDCGCAGGGAGSARGRALPYGGGSSGFGFGSGDSSYAPADGLSLQDGLWWDMSLGRPATGAQLQAMMARRTAREQAGQTAQPTPGIGAAMAASARQLRDAQGNLWLQLAPGQAPYLAENAPADCGGNQEYAIDENGQVVSMFNPDRAADTAAEQDLIRAGYQPGAVAMDPSLLAQAASQHAQDATTQANGAAAANAAGNTAAAVNLAQGAADSATKAVAAVAASANASANANITPAQLAANLANARPSPVMAQAQRRMSRKSLTPAQRRMKMLSGVKMDDADTN